MLVEERTQLIQTSHGLPRYGNLHKGRLHILQVLHNDLCCHPEGADDNLHHC